MISLQRMEKALTYLAETDERAAKAKALSDGMTEQRKTIKAMVYLQATGTNGEREQKAYASQSYKDHLEKMESTSIDWEILKNKRKTEELIVDAWRSLNANRRQGNVI